MYFKDVDLTKTKSQNYFQIPNFVYHFARKTILSFILFTTIAVFIPWTQTIKGKGAVIAYSPNERIQSIDSPIYGRIGKWYVQEGSFVKEGDPIVEILDNDEKLMTRLNVQKDAIVKKLKAKQDALKVGKINVDRQAKLLAKGLSSKRDLEKAKLDYSKYEAEEAKVKAEVSKIETKIARQATQLVKAPLDGYIQRRKSGYGTSVVKVNEVLAVIIPKTKSRSVELWIDGNDAPFVKIGDHVRLQFEGWPAIQSFGWPSLAKGTFGGRITFIDTAINPNGKSRLLIAPDSKSNIWPDSNLLRQGVITIGWVLVNEVTLGYELWRNFNALPPIATEQKLLEKIGPSPNSSSKKGKK